MNRLFFLASLVAVIACGSGCKDDKEEPGRPRQEMLTGTSSKTWRMVSSSIDDDQNLEPVCKATSARSMDNKWEFFANGSFEFYNGTVTSDANCQEGCCQDRIDLYGTWSMGPSNNQLILTAKGSLENGVRLPLNPELIMNATIQKITDTELVVKESDVVDTFVPVD